MREFRKKIEAKLVHEEWTTAYDHKESTLRVEDKQTKKGVTLQLKPLLAKWERNEFGSIDEVVRYVELGLHSMKIEVSLEGNEKNIYPVIRSSSFPTETKENKQLIYHEHTGETRIYYAVDLGESYTLIHEEMIKSSKLTADKIREIALFNIRSLEHPLNEDRVAGNTFYFLRAKDGYDASRILDQSLIDKMERKVTGKLAVAIPHQDVLIFADIQNDTGYDVLAQIALQFFKDGRIPVTALPFLYENGELEPTFILAQKKPKDPSSTKK